MDRDYGSDDENPALLILTCHITEACYMSFPISLLPLMSSLCCCYSKSIKCLPKYIFLRFIFGLSFDSGWQRGQQEIGREKGNELKLKSFTRIKAEMLTLCSMCCYHSPVICLRISSCF